jgi:hypothetical protein
VQLLLQPATWLLLLQHQQQQFLLVLLTSRLMCPLPAATEYTRAYDAPHLHHQHLHVQEHGQLQVVSPFEACLCVAVLV